MHYFPIKNQIKYLLDLAESNEETHTVKSGDMLSKIAQQYGMSLDELIKLNSQIKDPNKIKPGDVIKIKSAPTPPKDPSQNQKSKPEIPTTPRTDPPLPQPKASDVPVGVPGQTTKPSTPKNPERTGSVRENFGFLSRRFEANEIGTISPGKGDAGGASYGLHQFSSKTGGVQGFVGYLENKYDEKSPLRALTQHKDWTDYNGKFADTWRALAKSHPEELTRASMEYAIPEYYHRPLNALRRKNPQLAQRIDESVALQELFYSSAIQHGAGGVQTVFNNALMKCKDKTCPFELTDKVFDERAIKMRNAEKASKETKNSVINIRYPKERQLVKDELNKEKKLAQEKADKEKNKQK
jgi:LysM repeat protein